MIAVAAAGLGAAGVWVTTAAAEHFEPLPAGNVQAFDPIGTTLGLRTPPPADARPVSLHGSTIAAWGDGAVAIDADSGELVRVDAAGAVIGRVEIGADAGLLAADRRAGRVYVADRMGDRVAVVKVTKRGLRTLREIETRTEPYGVALSPDGDTVYVTHVADQRLSAYATADGREQWSVALGPEPRGVAVSPDGAEAIVTFLTTGAVAHVGLAGDAPRVRFSELPAGSGIQAGFGGFMCGGGHLSNDRAHFARAAFAATFVGHGMAVVPHQSSTPGEDTGFEDPGVYGGGVGPQVAHRLAFVRDARGVVPSRVASAELGVHQPRAVAYAPATDTLYVAGYGSDSIAAITDVSQAGARGAWSRSVAHTDGACGPTGVDAREDGSIVVFCGLSRRIVTLGEPDERNVPIQTALSDPVTDSRLGEAAQRGREMFRRGGSPQLSGNGILACSTCHPEARTDGLSWRIEGKALQTPLLAGRIAGTHPYKWDGKDATITDSLTHTVIRLGGTGISEQEVADLRAYLESLPAPRAPSVDGTAVARGEKLFRDDAVGCVSCHTGAPLTDGKRYDLADDLDAVDTPSLIGLAVSAPYYHDGSAATLEALLYENGSIHGMGNTRKLTDSQVRDLAAYLRTL